jgi:SAM-dependent methyltransferase
MNLPSNPVPYADFVVNYLMQHPEPGLPQKAVAETEEAIEGDRWFWADDNAKILELFALPSLWARYPGECIDFFKFIRQLCYGPFILRRIGHARLDQTSDQGGGQAMFQHTFMHIGCDLSQGMVSLGMRFHDGRTAKNMILGGNWVEFTFEGKRHRLQVDSGIVDWAIDRQGPLLILKHTTPLRLQLQDRQIGLGSMNYAYTIDSRSMFVDVSAELSLGHEISLTDIVFTISCNHLSHGENGVNYGLLQTLSSSGVSKVDAGDSGINILDQAGVKYWSLVQSRVTKGFALAIHNLPETPANFSHVETEVNLAGVWHRVAACYRFEGTQKGVTLRAGERKVITSGGFYDLLQEYFDMFEYFGKLERSNPIDFSISYDIGAEINSFARLVRLMSLQPDTDQTREIRDSAKQLFDTFYEVYEKTTMRAQAEDASAIFSRPLAFAALGLSDMFLVTGEESYRHELRKVVEILLTFDRPFLGEDGKTESAFYMGLIQSADPHVDCHSSVLLALIRALPILEDPALITKIDQGLDALRIETMGITLGDVRKQDLLCVGRAAPGQEHKAHAYWNFNVGLTLRVFKLLRQSTHQATREIYERHKDRIAIQEALMNLQIERSLRHREKGLEVKTGWLSTEGNSETQPWVALGLITDSGDLPVDHVYETSLSRRPNRGDIVAAYNLLLGRDPESEAIVNGHLNTHATVTSLRQSFFLSEELRRNFPTATRHQGLPITVFPLEIEVDVSDEILAEMVRKTGEYWSKVGREAPHWSVVTATEFLPENIAQHKELFFESSRVDEELILAGLARVGTHPSSFNSCVEFGCGVGRLTFRLASLFPKVVGIDISSPHLSVAREYCKSLGLNNVDFVQSNAESLMPATGFDFWFSRIVLQHNAPPVAMAIIKQAFQSLNSGGVAMFQVPVHRVGYKFRARDYLASNLGEDMETHCLPQRAILEQAQAHGLQLLDLREDTWVVSDSPDWLSNNFIFRKT